MAAVMPPPGPAAATPRDGERRTLAWQILGAAVLLALLWVLREAVIVGFGAVLVAAALLAGARPLCRRTGLQRRWAVLLVLTAVTVIVALLAWGLGDPVGEQLRALRDSLPRAWDSLQQWLARQPWGLPVLDWFGDTKEMQLPWGGLGGVATGTLHALSVALLIVLMGIYLAVDVPLYRQGLVRLFPLSRRERVSAALHDAGHALTKWLLGQGVVMLAVGVITTLGLMLIDMPMAIVLGLIAGLLEFVPFFGPVVAGLLVVLVAFPEGPQMALYAAGVMLAVQQVENHLLTPLVQRWAVELPPVLSLGSVLVFGTLFGLPGIVFGTPLMVLVMVLVRRLYVEETLEQRAPSGAG